MDAQAALDALVDAQQAVGTDAAFAAAPLVGDPALVVAGQHKNQVWHIVVDLDESAAAAYFKPINGVDRRIAQIYGHDPVSVTISECAAWRLAYELGVPWRSLIAQCVLRFEPAVDERAPGALSAALEGGPPRDAYTVAPDDCASAAFFDALIGQQDRHDGNMRWHAGSRALGLFDHGFAFAVPDAQRGYSKLVQWRWGYHDRRLADGEVEALRRVLEDNASLGIGRYLEERRHTAFRRRAERMLAARRILPPGASF